MIVCGTSSFEFLTQTPCSVFLRFGALLSPQQIDVRNLLTGGQCTVMRVWVRVPMTHEDQAGVVPGA